MAKKAWHILRSGSIVAGPFTKDLEAYDQFYHLAEQNTRDMDVIERRLARLSLVEASGKPAIELYRFRTLRGGTPNWLHWFNVHQANLWHVVHAIGLVPAFLIVNRSANAYTGAAELGDVPFTVRKFPKHFRPYSDVEVFDLSLSQISVGRNHFIVNGSASLISKCLVREAK